MYFHNCCELEQCLVWSDLGKSESVYMRRVATVYTPILCNAFLNYNLLTPVPSDQDRNRTVTAFIHSNLVRPRYLDAMFPVTFGRGGGGGRGYININDQNL